jgi:phosphate transport system substrate-binding protein
MPRQFQMIRQTLLIAACCLLGACLDKTDNSNFPDTPSKGKITISADESFKPVVDELVKVYESNHPGTTIRVLYKPEAECFKDFGVDSIKMVIATRAFTEDERKFMVDSLKVAPVSVTVARDAIAVIVNPLNRDTTFTMREIKDMLTGRSANGLVPVFDGLKATSTVRFIADSVLRGEPLSPGCLAARSSTGVIDYVSQTKNAVGFIGISWIGNIEDTQQLGFLQKVKMAALASHYDSTTFVKAWQQNIYNFNYPMVRDLVYTLKEKYHGLAYGFAWFVSGEIGQLIFRRAYLVPHVQKNFGIREIRVNE